MSGEVVREDIATIARNLVKDAKKFEGKTILLSGGGGFLGKYITGTFSYLNDEILSKEEEQEMFEQFQSISAITEKVASLLEDITYLESQDWAK